VKNSCWLLAGAFIVFLAGGCAQSGQSDEAMYSEAQAIRQYNEKALEKMELPPGDGPSQM
jgi:hypothetical protein